DRELDPQVVAALLRRALAEEASEPLQRGPQHALLEGLAELDLVDADRLDLAVALQHPLEVVVVGDGAVHAADGQEEATGEGDGENYGQGHARPRPGRSGS